jgi:hypothetical protein
MGDTSALLCPSSDYRKDDHMDTHVHERLKSYHTTTPNGFDPQISATTKATRSS